MVTIHSFSIKYRGFWKTDIFWARKMSKKKFQKYFPFSNFNHFPSYYVDIYIPSKNKCIEFKSLYTYNDNVKTNILKQEAAKNLGYDFEFWIYDNKGNRIYIE